MCKREDKRVTKTKNLIKAAYFTCIQELGLKKTTVKEICDRAYISRKTFYTHYETIDFLFDEVMDECFSFHDLESPVKIHKLQIAYRYTDYPRYLNEVIEQFTRHNDILRAVGGNLRYFLELNDPWFEQYFENRCSYAFLPEPPADDHHLHLIWELLAKEKCVFTRFSLMNPDVSSVEIAKIMAQTVDNYVHLVYTNSSLFADLYNLPSQSIDRV